IAFGAWLGGRAADHTDPRRLLGPLLVVGGLTAMASPLIVHLVGPTASAGPLSIVIVAILGFFVPAALLSAVPPVVVKIRLRSLDETGTVVGSYSAIGTTGAIFGTFLTGFFLIAAFPTRPIILGLGGLLTLGGWALWSTRTRWQGLGILLALATLGAVLTLVAGPCQYETTYHCAVIEVDPTRPTGRTLILDRLSNSYIDLADPTHLEFRYIKLMADILETRFPSGPVDTVSIGGGGFTLPGYINATRPGGLNLVLEIDAALRGIAAAHLALKDDIEVIIDDARISMRSVADDSASVVVGDAFSGASVPWHLTTVEFAQEIRRVLRPDGIYAMNVIDLGALSFARSATAALGAVFVHVAVFAPPAYFDGTQGGNFVLVASETSIDVAGIETVIRGRGGAEEGLAGDDLTVWIGNGIVLRDDYAPVDQILGRFRSTGPLLAPLEGSRRAYAHSDPGDWSLWRTPLHTGRFTWWALTDSNRRPMPCKGAR
ncbi:MAG TPA: fused MFS/spermidine synthase, partial [Acidimicrobiia bacterium]